jgi:hypothetical protein
VAKRARTTPATATRSAIRTNLRIAHPYGCRVPRPHVWSMLSHFQNRVVGHEKPGRGGSNDSRSPNHAEADPPRNARSLCSVRNKRPGLCAGQGGNPAADISTQNAVSPPRRFGMNLRYREMVGSLNSQSNQMSLGARGQTRRSCEQATGGHCRAIAVPDTYSVSGILCNDRTGNPNADISAGLSKARMADEQEG